MLVAGDRVPTHWRAAVTTCSPTGVPTVGTNRPAAPGEANARSNPRILATYGRVWLRFAYPPADPFGQISIQTVRAGRPCEVRVRLKAEQVDRAAPVGRR
jgi:hypothetical protein